MTDKIVPIKPANGPAAATCDDALGFAAVFAAPAPLANRFYVTVHDATVVRFGFVEFPPNALGLKEPQLRAAFSLSLVDTLRLRDYLNAAFPPKDATA